MTRIIHILPRASVTRLQPTGERLRASVRSPRTARTCRRSCKSKARAGDDASRHACPAICGTIGAMNAAIFRAVVLCLACLNVLAAQNADGFPRYIFQDRNLPFPVKEEAENYTIEIRDSRPTSE